MPTQNFETMASLPHVACTEEHFYELCRTLKPMSGGLVDGSSLAVNGSGQIVPGNFSPYFRKITKTFTDLSQAAATFDIELFQLPASGVIHAIKMKTSVLFGGGAISAYTLSIGVSANLNKYMIAKSVLGAVSSTNWHIVWAPFFNSLLPASLPIGAAYNQTEITNLRNVLTSLFTGAIGMEDAVSPQSIRLAATSTGGNLSLATQGSVDVWVLYSTLS